MKENLKVVISGGGTGGHIFPAIAIADALKRRFPKADILFIGAKGRMEMERVPKAGYPIEGLWISGMTKDIKSLLLPLKLTSSFNHAIAILKRFKPDVVIGVGGFASGPTLMGANFLRIPTVIQEQNSYPGKTNRNVGQKAKAICVAYDHLDQWFPAKKIHFTGNPLRANITLRGTPDEASGSARRWQPRRLRYQQRHQCPTCDLQGQRLTAYLADGQDLYHPSSRGSESLRLGKPSEAHRLHRPHGLGLRFGRRGHLARWCHVDF